MLYPQSCNQRIGWQPNITEGQPLPVPPQQGERPGGVFIHKPAGHTTRCGDSGACCDHMGDQTNVPITQLRTACIPPCSAACTAVSVAQSTRRWCCSALNSTCPVALALQIQRCMSPGTVVTYATAIATGDELINGTAGGSNAASPRNALGAMWFALEGSGRASPCSPGSFMSRVPSRTYMSPDTPRSEGVRETSKLVVDSIKVRITKN